MANSFFVKLNRNQNFTKVSGRVEIYALLNPQSNRKNFISIHGTKPLTPCVIDNSLMKYVLFAEKLLLIKTIDFIPCFTIDGKSNFFTYFPFPHEYIVSKLNKKEKKMIEDELVDCENLEVMFFQAMVKNEK